MELHLDLCGMLATEHIPEAHYTVSEDNSDPSAVIILKSGREDGEILLDSYGVDDLIDVLTMLKSRML